MATLAELLALLPDNVDGEISAQDVRDAITGTWGLSTGDSLVDQIQFNTSAGEPAHSQGNMHWNTDDGTLNIDSEFSGVTLQVGQEQWLRVRNNSGALIPNGRPVRLTGASGNRPTVGLDIGMGAAVGLATHDIANNASGMVTQFGLVRDLNTSAFASGQAVYASATGTLTGNLTSSRVGHVLLAHVTNGIVLVDADRRTHGSGTTAARPTTVIVGFMYFDTTLGIPTFWNGADWVNASGAVV